MESKTMANPFEDGVGSGEPGLRKGSVCRDDPTPLTMNPETLKSLMNAKCSLSAGAPRGGKWEDGVPHHRVHRSLEEGPGLGSLLDALSGHSSTSPATAVMQMFLRPKGGHLTSQPSDLTARLPADDNWSPAVTEKPTPPFESRKVSSLHLESGKEHDGEGNATDISPGSEQTSPSNPVSDKPPPLRQFRKFFGRRTSSRVGPSPSEARSPSLNPSFTSAVAAKVVPLDSYDEMSVQQEIQPISPSSERGSVLRAPFGGPLPFMTPRRRDSIDDAEIGDESVELGLSVSAATRRAEPEGDVEEGGVSTTATVAEAEAETALVAEARAATQPAAVSAVALASVADVVASEASSAATVVVNGIVLPSAPSDEEKVSYHKTGRVLLVSTGMIAFCTLTTGMWLFTMASPYFFWFGVPTVFLMFYLIFHYFVVAIRGKDFNPEAHAEIVRAASEQGYLPTIDVFLPVCNEDIALLGNTWEYVAAIDYPNFSVYVLDDGAKDDVRDLAAERGFHYIRRDNRPEMKKAGNLRYAFARTSGDAVVIFDADFCPRSDFLRETTPYLLDPTIGILQTPQYFRWREEQTWVEKGAGPGQEFFYRMVQMNQDRFNGAVCVGSCGLYRRGAVESFGGVAAISHSEDMYTGFKMTELGYKIKYIPLCLAMGICPDEPRSFFMQQYRWCMGSATLVSEKGFWSANISRLHKICFFNGLLYYVANVMLLVLTPVPIVLLIFMKADGVLWFYSGFAVPSLIMMGAVVPLWAKQPFGMSCHRVRILQCYAHVYALKDCLMGTAAVWIPSGGGASRSSSKAYTSSVRLMLTWTIVNTLLIVGGSAWRMIEFPWYHFVPSIALAMGNFFLNISTLWY